MPLLPYTSAGSTSWNTHKEVTLRELDYPLFEGEPAHFTVRRTYEGPAATYAAATLDTADAEFSTAFFVKQSPLQDIGGGCVRYERLFATVPASWSEPESFAYTFPAYIAGTPGTSYSITSLVVSGANLVFTTSATGISAGDPVSAVFAYTRGTAPYRQTLHGKAVAATGGSSVTLAGALLGSSGGALSAISGTLARTAVGRVQPQSNVVGSRLVNAYALATIETLNTALPLIDQFFPTDTLGYATDSLGSGTIPTSAAYGTSVINGDEIVAECSRRRYLGNIFVRMTRLVPAS